jgi:hypothetical protein
MSCEESLQNRTSAEQTVAAATTIEINLRDPNQLFDVLDPSPFREKDLDSDAEEYIVESAKELPSRATFALLIHFDKSLDPGEERTVRDAIHVHFARRSRVMHRALRQLLRRGLISLGIGLAFLTVFFIIAQVLRRVMGESSLATLFREGLMIVGWVAMWRPLEIFLYDWWPIVGERLLYDRLSRIEVRIVPKDGVSTISAPQPGLMTRETARALARWENEGGSILPPSDRANASLAGGKADGNRPHLRHDSG